MSTESSAALFVLVVLLLGDSLSAAITEGARTVDLNYSYTYGAGDFTETVTDSASGGDGTFIEIATGLTGGTERSTFAGDLRFSLAATGSFSQEADPDTGEVVYTLMEGGQSSLVEMEGVGTFLMEGGFGSGSFSSLNPGDELFCEFTVTDVEETGRLRLSMQRRLETDDFIQCFVQRREGAVWQTQKTYGITGRTTLFSESITFVPGEWRILCRMPVAANFGEGPGSPDEIDIDQALEFTLEFGTPPGSYPLPAEGDYTHPEIYNRVVDSAKLASVNPQILGETPQGDGFTEVEFTTNLVNSSLCPWSVVEVQVRTDRPETILVENVTFLTILDVPATSTVTGQGSGTIRVPDTQLAEVKAGILDGSLLITEGREQLVFRYPVDIIIDKGSVEDTASFPYQLEETVLPRFVVQTPSESMPDPRPFPPGSLLLEWEPFYSVPPRRLQPPGFPEPVWVENFDSQLPMWITNATLDQGTIQDPRYTSVLSGTSLSYLDLVKHGRIRHVYENPLEGYGGNATEGSQIDTQLFFGTVWPLHFDRVKLDEIVTFSGNFNFIPGPFVVDHEIANGSPQEFLVTMEYTAEVNLLLETTNHEEVGGSPVVDEEKTLFEAPIFAVTLPGGITFEPRFKLEAGAVVEATRSLSIPFTSRYTVKVTAGMKDGLPFYDDQSTVVPLQVSAPSIYEGIGASASVFLVGIDPLDEERDLLRLKVPALEERQFYQVDLPSGK